MSARPAALSTAVALLVILSLSFAFAGLVLLAAVVTGTIPESDALARAVVGIVAVVALGAALAGLASAGALWAGRSWGWAGSLGVALVGAAGAVTVMLTVEPQAPLLIGLALTLAALALLVLPSTREAALG